MKKTRFIRMLVEELLGRSQEAKDNRKVMCLEYWVDYEGLGDILGDELPAFRDWWVNVATCPSVLHRRAREIQNDKRLHEPSPKVREERERKSRQSKGIWG